jgi:Domain of unknown function (DUF4168)
MPSLFPPEETVFDRYAACLAATEGLRRIRDRDLAEEVNMRGFGASSSSSSNGGGGSSIYEAERQINLQYIQNSERVLRALGMSVNQFNDLGKQITQDEKLREKVGRRMWSGTSIRKCQKDGKVRMVTRNSLILPAVCFVCCRWT